MPEFNIEQDDRLIAEGTHFWCHACLTACLLDDQPPGPRYCLGCYEFLLKEWELIAGKRGRPDWVPAKAKILPVVKCAKTTLKQRTLRDIPVPIFAQPDGDSKKPDGGLVGRPALTLPVEK